MTPLLIPQHLTDTASTWAAVHLNTKDSFKMQD